MKKGWENPGYTVAQASSSLLVSDNTRVPLFLSKYTEKEKFR
jgi:hypothetical protein